MIKNLPAEFPVSALGAFDFGSAEAKDDPLLTSCPVPVAAMTDLLGGMKDIVLGYRGTGKSAIVRLLSEKKLEFKNAEGWKAHLVVLDDDLDYKTIREQLFQKAKDDSSRSLMCRIVWEILVIYRSLQSVNDHFGEADRGCPKFCVNGFSFNAA